MIDALHLIRGKNRFLMINLTFFRCENAKTARNMTSMCRKSLFIFEIERVFANRLMWQLL